MEKQVSTNQSFGSRRFLSICEDPIPTFRIFRIRTLDLYKFRVDFLQDEKMTDTFTLTKSGGSIGHHCILLYITALQLSNFRQFRVDGFFINMLSEQDC
jgi:hypothetical protein